ncbi:GntR family transcriptional regulator [Rhodopseudomonas boonkerdii]|uniref:GntR family transcriptional regulator n=1 Tax=Rhodopseudomonas boonkerdii TaxID=475937 RepID=UPI001E3ACDCF|nr:GntR family transcriptional regulator [Rhodopseudomonas boonkerdii]UGV26687.1 GntR family transcriptional regulator [Rhodopseudomonas boonkerdii]
MTSLKRIEREPLWDLAHAQLRDALLAGRFAPGTVLTLRSLAETFGTSITPVRDAVTRLVAQGVLQQGPRNAAIVPHLTRNELSDLTVVRCALEGRAAREAAKRPQAASLERLQALLAKMQSLIASRSLESYLEHHRKFHFEIYAMSGVPILVETIENMWLRCGPVLSFVIPEYVVLLKGWDHHTAALKAIIAGDGEAAEREIVADIMEAAQYLSGLADTGGQLRRPLPEIAAG